MSEFVKGKKKVSKGSELEVMERKGRVIMLRTNIVSFYTLTLIENNEEMIGSILD